MFGGGLGCGARPSPYIGSAGLTSVDIDENGERRAPWQHGAHPRRTVHLAETGFGVRNTPNPKPSSWSAGPRVGRPYGRVALRRDPGRGGPTSQSGAVSRDRSGWHRRTQRVPPVPACAFGGWFRRAVRASMAGCQSSDRRRRRAADKRPGRRNAGAPDRRRRRAPGRGRRCSGRPAPAPRAGAAPRQRADPSRAGQPASQPSIDGFRAGAVPGHRRRGAHSRVRR